jgi:hypothetical protein
MGRQSRAKKERAAAPTVTQLTAEQFYAIRACSLELQLFEQRAVELQGRLIATKVEQMKKAGLDPKRNYRLVQDTLQAELVEG